MGLLFSPLHLAIMTEHLGAPEPFYFYFISSRSSILSRASPRGNAIFLAGRHLLKLSLTLEPLRLGSAAGLTEGTALYNLKADRPKLPAQTLPVA